MDIDREVYQIVEELEQAQALLTELNAKVNRILHQIEFFPVQEEEVIDEDTESDSYVYKHY